MRGDEELPSPPPHTQRRIKRKLPTAHTAMPKMAHTTMSAVRRPRSLTLAVGAAIDAGAEARAGAEGCSASCVPGWTSGGGGAGGGGAGGGGSGSGGGGNGGGVAAVGGGKAEATELMPYDCGGGDDAPTGGGLMLGGGTGGGCAGAMTTGGDGGAGEGGGSGDGGNEATTGGGGGGIVIGDGGTGTGGGDGGRDRDGGGGGIMFPKSALSSCEKLLLAGGPACAMIAGGGGGDDCATVALRGPSSEASDQLQVRDVALLLVLAPATRAATALLSSRATASGVKFAAVVLSAQPGHASVQRATTAVALPAPETGCPGIGANANVFAGAAALKLERNTDAAPTARGAWSTTFHWYSRQSTAEALPPAAHTPSGSCTPYDTLGACTSAGSSVQKVERSSGVGVGADATTVALCGSGAALHATYS